MTIDFWCYINILCVWVCVCTRGIGRAATLLKTLLQYFGKSLEALPGVAYPGFRDNRSTLNTKTGFKKICMYVCIINKNTGITRKHASRTIYTSTAVVQPNWVTILVLAAVETHRQTNPHAQCDDVQNSTRLLVVNRDS